MEVSRIIVGLGKPNVSMWRRQRDGDKKLF